jgi:pyruvate formate lyase activating enzyme
MPATGLIFDIKKFAIHDGPGIRTTVFFKGCPLHCPWCHNPEGIAPRPEIMVFVDRCLTPCRDCIAACPRKAIAKSRGRIRLDRARCDGCGACARVCPSEALQASGRAVAVGEVVAELAKDEPFYKESGGGVTFSGGEPLSQPEFLRELLLACRERRIATAVDTSGHAPFAEFEKIFPLTDLFLFDLKLVDSERHERLTGVANLMLIDNLRRLSAVGAALAIRLPLLPGVNDSESDLEQAADLCAALPRRHPVHILPYHRGYVGKALRLGRDETMITTAPPSREALARAKAIFRQRRLAVIEGG